MFKTKNNLLFLSVLAIMFVFSFAFLANAKSTQGQGQVQSQQGQVNAEQHKSAVADFVQGLLQIADRQGGIGEQVRTIAQQQNQSASTTVQAMEQIQTRSRIKTFLMGNRLEQLNKLMENVQNTAEETELQNQIQALEQEQTKIEDFIESQEGQFSLFGWLLKLFNR